MRSVRDERLSLLETLSGLHARRAELHFAWGRDEESRRQATLAGRTAAETEVRELRQRLGAAEDLIRSVLAERNEAAAEAEQSAPEQQERPGRSPWYRSRRTP
ncbi:hypothetical protein SLNWT_3299 [Streptomyces albus]|uniref:Uncharacterized protein n=1 Tax=Streptomyces albus (strain ATCC 21838 / DSM 41398 / FERM P-419 / JCM 4703 / NBRC 107858) TaxID=1081613 RepID=A0A0B5EWU0_STRA4|nr:hypothetical protein SLNWT_3299 [Streptomyces albus]AOU77983.1 hypothetical protein SLNHY_3292 [Streptomyces albus]